MRRKSRRSRKRNEKISDRGDRISQMKEKVVDFNYPDH